MKFKGRLGSRAITALASASLLLGLTSVVSSSDTAFAANYSASGVLHREASTNPSIWYINPLTTYPLFTAAQDAFNAAASKYGYAATVVGSSTINIPEQISYINQAVTSGAKAIIYFDLDPATYSKTVAEAQAKGVVMISMGGIDTFSDYAVGTGYQGFGETAAQTIAKSAGKAANVVVFGNDLSNPSQAAPYHAFLAYAKSHYPKMKATYVFTHQSPTTTSSLLKSLPQAYPKANAIWFVEGGDVSVITSSLKHAGVKNGKYFILAIDNVPTTLAQISNGYVSQTLAQCVFWATPFAAQLALAKLGGKGPTQQTWNIGLLPVTKAQLPFKGCPSSFYPTLP